MEFWLKIHHDFKRMRLDAFAFGWLDFHREHRTEHVDIKFFPIQPTNWKRARESKKRVESLSNRIIMIKETERQKKNESHFEMCRYTNRTKQKQNTICVNCSVNNKRGWIINLDAREKAIQWEREKKKNQRWLIEHLSIRVATFRMVTVHVFDVLNEGEMIKEHWWLRIACIVNDHE